MRTLWAVMATLWGTVCIFTLTLYIHVGEEDRGVISTDGRGC
jgi:hypothetical protein